MQRCQSIIYLLDIDIKFMHTLNDFNKNVVKLSNLSNS